MPTLLSIMSQGQERLRDWIGRSKLSQRAAADLLDMHWTFLNQILNDKRSPALATAVRIERMTGIPVEAWMPTDVDSQPVGAGGKNGKRKVGKG